MPKIHILNSASDEEVAVIISAINNLSKKEVDIEPEVFSKWQNYSRRAQENRALWESNNNSLWYLEAKRIK